MVRRPFQELNSFHAYPTLFYENVPWSFFNCAEFCCPRESCESGRRTQGWSIVDIAAQGMPAYSAVTMAPSSSLPRSSIGYGPTKSRRSILSPGAPGTMATLKVFTFAFATNAWRGRLYSNCLKHGWRQRYNRERPHSKLGYQSSEAFIKQPQTHTPSG